MARCRYRNRSVRMSADFGAGRPGAPRSIYYSETRTVSIALKLLRLSKDQTGFNFDFRMAYKMIRESDAVVRYGNPFVGTCFFGDHSGHPAQKL